MRNYSLFLATILFVLFSCNKHKTSISAPINVTCEHVVSPINIDTQSPVFGWQFADSANGISQSAYQILISTSADSLSETSANMWNSGKVKSGQSQFVAYGGKPLQPATRYFWVVQNFDTAGNALGYSKPATFETALFTKENWNAGFLTVPSILKSANSAYFRNTIAIDKKPVHARVYATGLGAYSLYINGKKAGNEQLAPGWSVFSKHLQYQVYDVDSLLVEGNNAWGSVVANFWNGYNKLIFSALLKVELEDGSVKWFKTDETWIAAEAPVLESSYNTGEKYDAKKELPDWASAGFDAKNWVKAKTVENPFNLVCQQLPSIQVIKSICPAKVIKSGSNTFVFDLGETISGWVKLNKINSNDKAISIAYLAIYDLKDKKAGKLVATDKLLGLNDIISWEPDFSYHTFRYVEVSGISEADSTTLSGQLAIPAILQTGHFACANELVNKISDAIIRTGRNALVSQITGFPDDATKKSSSVCASAFATTAAYNFDMTKAFANYMMNLADVQGKDGRLHFLKDETSQFSPGWADVMVQLPWQAYVGTGDIRLLRNNYDAIKAWHDAQQRESDVQAPPYMHNKEGKGDLFSIAETPSTQIGSTYYFYASNTLNQIAEALGQPEDATVYMELAGFTKDQFNQSYLTYRTARYWVPTQAAHILPLAVGLSPLSHSQRIADFIAADVVKNGNHPTTGVLATKFLLPILSQYNHHELAYKLISEKEKPSLGYMVNKGSTTIWGSWDGADEAANYQLTLASMGEWLYAYLVGLQLDTKQPGFKHVIFDPNPVKGLDWAECSVNTLYGKLFARWDNANSVFSVKVSIPANTSMTLMLPVKSEANTIIKYNNIAIISNGTVSAQCPAYIKFKGFDSNMAVLEVGSGSFNFDVE